LSYALVELKLEWDGVGEVCVQVCVSVKAKERPHLLLKSVNRVQAVAVKCVAFILASFFVCSFPCDKQTIKQFLCGLRAMQTPHSWPFAMHISRRKIVGSM